jgi:hypothetical protein
MRFNFVGYLGEGVGRRDFVLRVLGPKRNLEGGDYFVELEAPAVLTKTERIFGVDEDQAWQLAVRYLIARLEGRSLYDQDGRPIDVRELLERS